MEDSALPLYNDVFSHIKCRCHRFYMATVIMYSNRNP